MFLVGDIINTVSKTHLTIIRVQSGIERILNSAAGKTYGLKKRHKDLNMNTTSHHFKEP